MLSTGLGHGLLVGSVHLELRVCLLGLFGHVIRLAGLNLGHPGLVHPERSWILWRRLWLLFFFSVVGLGTFLLPFVSLGMAS